MKVIKTINGPVCDRVEGIAVTTPLQTYNLIDTRDEDDPNYIISKCRKANVMEAQIYFDRCGYLGTDARPKPGLKITRSRSDFSMNVTLYTGDKK